MDEFIDGKKGVKFRDAEPESWQLHGSIIGFVQDIPPGSRIVPKRGSIVPKGSDIAFQCCFRIFYQAE